MSSIHFGASTVVPDNVKTLEELSDLARQGPLRRTTSRDTELSLNVDTMGFGGMFEGGGGGWCNRT